MNTQEARFIRREIINDHIQLGIVHDIRGIVRDIEGNRYGFHLSQFPVQGCNCGQCGRFYPDIEYGKCPSDDCPSNDTGELRAIRREFINFYLCNGLRSIDGIKKLVRLVERREHGYEMQSYA